MSASPLLSKKKLDKTRYRVKVNSGPVFSMAALVLVVGMFEFCLAFGKSTY